MTGHRHRYTVVASHTLAPSCSAVCALLCLFIDCFLVSAPPVVMVHARLAAHPRCRPTAHTSMGRATRLRRHWGWPRGGFLDAVHSSFAFRIGFPFWPSRAAGMPCRCTLPDG